MPMGEIVDLESKARTAIESGRDEESELILESILNVAPQHHFALKELSNISRKRQDFVNAMVLCDQAIAAHPDDIWLVFDKAQILRDQGLFDEACLVYHDVLARRPHFHHAYRGLGQVARLRGRIAEALTFFRLARDQPSSDEWDRFDAADMLRASGRIDEAATELTDLLADKPDFFHAERVLGLIALAKGDYENSIRLFENVYQKNPSDLWNLSDLARVYNRIGRVEKSMNYYKIIIKDDEKFTTALLSLCHIYIDLFDIENASKLLARAQELECGELEIQFDIGHAYIRLGRLAEAVAVYRRLSADPSQSAAISVRFVDVLRKHALQARCSGDFTTAAGAWQEIVNIQPDDKKALLDLARDLSRTDDLEGACNAYRALLRDPEHASTAACEMFHCLRQRGACDRASEGVCEALEIVPNEPRLLICHAIHCREIGDYDRADALCDTALTAGADPCEALIEKALTAKARNNEESAETLLNLALERDPSRSSAHFELSKLLVAQERFDEARGILDRAVVLSPSEAILQLAALEQCAGDRDRADEILREALARDPDNLDALMFLAALRRTRAKASNALVAQARSIAPNDIRVVEGAAKLALDSGDLERALAGYRDAIRIAPSLLWPRVVVARLTALVEDDEQGVLLFRSLIDFAGQQPDVCLAFVDLLEQLGRLDEADAISSHMLQTHPRNAALWTQGALLQLRRGDYARVEKMLATPPDACGTDLIAGRLALARFDHPAATDFLSKALKKHRSDQAILKILTHLALLAFDFPSVEGYLETLQDVSGCRASSTHLGNLYNEFRLDNRLTQRVREAPENRVEMLRSIVLDSPEFTPASLAFLIELRRKGLITPPPMGACPIPAVIAIFSGTSPRAKALSSRAASWRIHAPQCEVQTFDEESAWSRIRSSGRNDLIKAFHSAAEPAIRHDLFRLFHLHTRGGIFVDLDVMPQSAFSGLIERASEMVVLQDEFGAVGKGMIATIAGHWLIEQALNDAITAVNGGDHDMAWLCSGSGLMSRTLASCLCKSASGWTEVFTKLYVVTPEQSASALALDCWVQRS